MLASYDVLDLERDHGLVIAMQVAVLTPVAGAFIYQPPASGVHQDAPWRDSQRRALA